MLNIKGNQMGVISDRKHNLFRVSIINLVNHGTPITMQNNNIWAKHCNITWHISLQIVIHIMKLFDITFSCI